ncbi:YjcZ family sporulation protein [Bacillus cereus]|nr:YjcZ family sporulation protein [Bacillus cereus]
MYGYSYCYPTCSYPSYGYGGFCGGSGRGFALIVVLFILLIIVGAACIR